VGVVDLLESRGAWNLRASEVWTWHKGTVTSNCGGDCKASPAGPNSSRFRAPHVALVSRGIATDSILPAVPACAQHFAVIGLSLFVLHTQVLFSYCCSAHLYNGTMAA
jgi:hypothetical protein